jgi:glycine/serine hydroxymethyltransferase
VIQVWITKDDAANVAALIEKLNGLVKAHPTVKACVFALDEARKDELAKIANENVIVAVAAPGTAADLSKKYKLNAEVKNTVHVYKGKKVTANLVDLTAADFAKLETAAAAVAK